MDTLEILGNFVERNHIGSRKRMILYYYITYYYNIIIMAYLYCNIILYIVTL